MICEPLLPGLFRPGEPVPADLIGARIVRFEGAEVERGRFEGGGLVIEYVPDGASSAKTIVFEFNELGMWESETVS
jgi:hypothetical protein